ncbi:MAG: hypothetical protein NZ521_07685 [Flammeovirgaceae bacterium]|nr:hypothetical protein [Flammeovirgaceae bacterium]MDW8288090.1 hypothetical protein [Flammeovirgaceae bacterium]
MKSSQKYLYEWIFYCLLANLFFSSCNIGTIEPMENAKTSAYYPLVKGKYIIYEVLYITYKGDLGPNDTVKYLLKEKINADFIDATGTTTFLLDRFKRTASQKTWEIDSVWAVRIDRNRIVKQEHNLPLIKLVFPERENLSWNGNALNNLPTVIYTMKNVGKPFVVKTKNFPKTVVVEQKNEKNLLRKNIEREVYAKDIGLIYKYVELINYVSETGSPNYGKDVIVSGFLLEQKILESGVE